MNFRTLNSDQLVEVLQGEVELVQNGQLGGFRIRWNSNLGMSIEEALKCYDNCMQERELKPLLQNAILHLLRVKRSFLVTCLKEVIEPKLRELGDHEDMDDKLREELVAVASRFKMELQKQTNVNDVQQIDMAAVAPYYKAVSENFEKAERILEQRELVRREREAREAREREQELLRKKEEEQRQREAAALEEKKRQRRERTAVIRARIQ